MPRNNEQVEGQHNSTLEAGALAVSVQSLFRPVARMLARRGIGARTTTEMIKQAYVSGTIDVLRERGLPITTARLSVFTGLTQREIQQIQSDLKESAQNQPDARRELAQLLATWNDDPRYSIPFTGTPFELDFDEPSNRPTFVSLVRECAPGRSPKELLATLVRVGAARINEETGRVQALMRSFISEPYSGPSVKRFDRMVRNLIETLYRNFETPAPAERRFDRNAIADFSIDASAEEAFRKHVQVEGERFVVAIDKWLQTQKQEPENGRRVGVAVFHFVEALQEGEEAEYWPTVDVPQPS